LNPLNPPITIEIKRKAIKIKKMILAIPAAPAAIPPKPNIAATRAITRKIIIRRNIIN
jgi:hypothetical protein